MEIPVYPWHQFRKRKNPFSPIYFSCPSVDWFTFGIVIFALLVSLRILLFCFRCIVVADFFFFIYKHVKYLLCIQSQLLGISFLLTQRSLQISAVVSNRVCLLLFYRSMTHHVIHMLELSNSNKAEFPRPPPPQNILSVFHTHLVLFLF